MDKHKYTSIPDTSDTDYWQLKSANTAQRLKTFIPRDPELHRQLKQAVWDKILLKQRTRV